MSQSLQHRRYETLRRDENKLFLIDYKDSSQLGSRRSKIQHEFTVCNTDDTSKPLNVSVETSTNIIKCTCSDYRFRCYKNNIVCKHCIFIIQTVLRFNCSTLIDGRTIADIHSFNATVGRIAIVRSLEQIAAVAVAAVPVVIDRESSMLEISDARKAEVADDQCPICFIDFSDESDQENKILACPTCHNVVHSKCMKIWLTRSAHKNCVYCRADWSKFTV